MQEVEVITKDNLQQKRQSGIGKNSETEEIT
jgi:hypothetical protein